MRTFKLINSNNEVCDITTTNLFFHDPTGLGYARSLDYRRVGRRFVLVSKEAQQKSIGGKVALIGKDPYLAYYNFTQFLTKEPLVLRYTPNNEADPLYSESGVTYSRDVIVSKVDKTEMNKNGYLDCSIELDALGPWYRNVIIGNALGDNNDDDQLVWGYGYSLEFLEMGNICNVDNIKRGINTTEHSVIVSGVEGEPDSIKITSEGNYTYRAFVDYSLRKETPWLAGNCIKVSCDEIIPPDNENLKAGMTVYCQYDTGQLGFSVEIEIGIDPEDLEFSDIIPVEITFDNRTITLSYVYIEFFIRRVGSTGTIPDGSIAIFKNPKVEPVSIGGRAVDKTALFWSGNDGLLKFGPRSQWEEGMYSPGNSSGPSKLTMNGPLLNPEWIQYVDGVEVSRGKIFDTIVTGMQLVVDNISIPGKIYKKTIGASEEIDIYDKSDFTTERFVTIRPGRNSLILKDDVNEYIDPKVGIEWEGHIMYESV